MWKSSLPLIEIRSTGWTDPAQKESVQASLASETGGWRRVGGFYPTGETAAQAAEVWMRNEQASGRTGEYRLIEGGEVTVTPEMQVQAVEIRKEAGASVSEAEEEAYQARKDSYI